MKAPSFVSNPISVTKVTLLQDNPGRSLWAPDRFPPRLRSVFWLGVSRISLVCRRRLSSGGFLMGLAARFGRRGVSQCLDAQTRVHIYLCKFNAALCRVGLAARSYSLSMPLSLEPNRWKKVREPEGDEERFQRFERNVGNVSANFCCEECSRKTLSRPCSCSHLDTRWFGWYFIYLFII